jgi:hypothetical protein
MKYNDYLKTDHWKKIRIQTFHKQGNKCRICFSSNDLQIHHRRYYKNGENILFKEQNRDLLVLCKDCHFLWHNINGYQRIPFARLRRLLKEGKSKQIAFSLSYKRKVLF